MGALSKKLLADVGNSKDITICDMEFYSIGANNYEKTIVIMDLSKVINGTNLPSVYLTTISRIEVLNNSLICLSTEMIINEIGKDLNDSIIEILNKASYNQFTKSTNESINYMLNLFAESICAEMIVSHGEVEFRV